MVCSETLVGLREMKEIKTFQFLTVFIGLWGRPDCQLLSGCFFSDWWYVPDMVTPPTHVNFRCFSVGEYGLIICSKVRTHRRILIYGEKVSAVSDPRAQTRYSLFYLTTPGLLRVRFTQRFHVNHLLFYSPLFSCWNQYPINFTRHLPRDLWEGSGTGLNLYLGNLLWMLPFFIQNIASTLFSEFYYFLPSRLPVS